MTDATPTPPVPIAGAPRARLGPAAEVPAAVVERLASACASVSVDPADLAEHGRDWWPLAMTWALDGGVPGLPAVVVRPGDEVEVAAVARICNEARVPLTPAAGRSGVCGGAAPVFGGVVLDLCGLAGITAVDPESGLVEVLPGTFGDRFEDELQSAHGLTVGHWPQSMALSTVGGWVACRGAGQYSNRYGKIEDMVVGLRVVLADGTGVRTGGWPRAATGPDLTQVFVGSEGTLGIVTAVTLRARPVPAGRHRAAFGFATFAEGLDACRRVIRRGATPAVMRLYDRAESQRNFGVDTCALIVHDEADPAVVAATGSVLGEECASAAALDPDLVDRWFAHRNDVSALGALISRGWVVDTIEVSARWSALARIYDEAVAAGSAVPGVAVVSAHQSHAYPDGACLYFTFAGRPPDGTTPDALYRAVWDAVTGASLAHGGSLSHHHGVGINRGRYLRDALGDGGVAVLSALKRALDPNGILNPGKLGLPSPWGAPPWP
jgi:alkyldihydroxyacetonephosphate synthase